MILGIDSGHSKCGICLIDKEKVVYHKTTGILNAVELVEKIFYIYKFKKAVVEMPSESIFYSKHMRNAPAAIQRKIMCNVGENRECGKIIAMNLRKLGVRTLEKKPLRGTTKWPVQHWCNVFGWSGKRPPSEHARDASILALRMENSPEWKLYENRP